MSTAATRRYSTVVLGGGLGGLLAAATVARAGGSVVVIERLPYLGGRFTTVPQAGYEITTGALHMLPHGGGGIVAQMLRALGIPLRVVPRDVYASFMHQGRHILWRHPLDIFELFSPRARVELTRIMLEMKARPTMHGYNGFADWLDRRTGDPTLRRCFERFAEFALSMRLEQVSYAEMRAIFRSVHHYGMPAIPVGGCKAVVAELAAYIQEHGGTISTNTQATQLLLAPSRQRVAGVAVRDRHTHEEYAIAAERVISDLGPLGTKALVDSGAARELTGNWRDDPAAGMKLHIVSDQSLIPHNGILLCLDTRRIAGIVEVSRAVPSVTPPGMHMLDTFQVLQSDDIARERALALEDLREIFGPAFDRHCRVVRFSAFRRAWPVNHLLQGLDLREQEPIPGLIMIGDAYKPSGFIMAEGVAASVRSVVPVLTSSIAC